MEMHDDPNTQQGYKADRYIKRREVRQALRAQAAELPGPEVANVWFWQNPCKTFCDFCKLNGCTRTAQRPEGDGTIATEVETNENTQLLAEVYTILHRHGKAFLFENQAPGSCPKAWDLRCMFELMQETGARALP